MVSPAVITACGLLMLCLSSKAGHVVNRLADFAAEPSSSSFFDGDNLPAGTKFPIS
jgi:hypothetical protein